jgi:hypothetical protein
MAAEKVSATRCCEADEEPVFRTKSTIMIRVIKTKMPTTDVIMSWNAKNETDGP